MKRLSLFLLFCAACFGQTVSSGPIVLDPFTSARQNDESDQLWKTLDPGCATTTSISGGIWVINAPSGGSCTADGFTGPGLINQLFFPRGLNGWPWSGPPCTRTGCEYVQSYATTVPGATDWTHVNRMYWTVTSNTDHGLYPHNTSGGVQIGYFIRSHDNTASTNQGAHYYNFVDAGIYAGQTLYFVMNRKMQHNNQGTATDAYPEDPEWFQCCYGQGQVSPVHMWDGETTFYFAAGPNLGGWTGIFNFGTFTLGTETYQEPDDHVSAMSGTFTGPNANSCCTRPNNTYEVQWQEAKFIPGGENFHLYYSSTGSMHVSGLSSGTADGTVRGPDGSSGSAYANTWYNTPTMSKQTNMWVAVRPDLPIWSVTGTSPITITTGTLSSGNSTPNPNRHWLQNGDQVTIANLCANANGTRTVTVVDNYSVSLGVSGACSYAGYTGTGSGIMTATSNTQNFTEILIGPGSGPSPSAVASASHKGVRLKGVNTQ